jgi:hypothetical protein
MLDSVRRVVVFFLFFEASTLLQARGLPAEVVSLPDVSTEGG